MTLEELYNIVANRKTSFAEESYVANLMTEGIDRILQKIGEEATEVVIAGKNNIRKDLISESTDLLFHLVVLFSNQDIKLDQIYEELEKRRKIVKPSPTSYKSE